MAYWLIKSEPDAWSWDDQLTAKGRTTHWDGVRNAQACNNMRKMKRGDRALFYHSGGQKQIVGIVEVVKEAYADPSDEAGKACMVDVKAVENLPRPVTLAQIKAEKRLAHLALVRQPRLSVAPIDEESWGTISKMAGLSSQT